MPFFQKAKPRKAVKRKFEPATKKSKKPPKSTENEEDNDDDQSIDSDLEARDLPDRSDSEGEHETAQEKKVRLAKLYLSEIEQQEREREDGGDAIGDRLRDEYLETQGRLRRRVAAECTLASPEQYGILKCKQLRLSVTCMCLSGDGRHLFTGSKCSAIIKWSLVEKKRVAAVTFRKDSKQTDKFRFHTTSISALAISGDGKYLVSSEQKPEIHVWNPETMEHVHTFKGHRDRVNDLVFRKDSHQLFSASADRSVKVWSLDEMAYVETVFGHQCAVTAIDALSRERAVTAGGRDNTVRIWKIVEESQLVFNGHPGGSVDGVKLLNEENFISCGDDGALCLWGNMKKKPLCVVSAAHGAGPHGSPRWITCVATLLNSDLVASGSHDGFVRLWRVAENFKSLSPLMEIPVRGFINSLVFTPDGENIIAGVGQEHKLARWWREKDAKNAVYVIPILNKR